MHFSNIRTSIFSPVSPIEESTSRERNFRHSIQTAVSEDDARGRPATPAPPMPAAYTVSKAHQGRRHERAAASRSPRASRSPPPSRNPQRTTDDSQPRSTETECTSTIFPRQSGPPPSTPLPQIPTSPRRAPPPAPLNFSRNTSPRASPFLEPRRSPAPGGRTSLEPPERPESSNSARLEQPFTPNIPEFAVDSASTPSFPEKKIPTPAAHSVASTGKERVPRRIRFNKPNPFSAARAFLRVAVLGVTGAVIALCIHSLSVYGRTKGEDAAATARVLDGEEAFSPTWPEGTSLAPVYLALAVAFAHFCATVALAVLSWRNLFANPLSWSNFVRIWADGFFVLAWIAAVVVFRVLEDEQRPGSLGAVACGSRGLGDAGEFELVCREQNVVFPLSITAIGLEVVVLVSLAVGAYIDHRKPPPYTNNNSWQQLA